MIGLSRPFWAACLGGFLCTGNAACGDDVGSEASTLPTHSATDGAEAGQLPPGVLAANGDCVWIETTEGDKLAVLFPPGYTLEDVNGEATLINADGEHVAAVGERVSVAGGIRSGAADFADECSLPTDQYVQAGSVSGADSG